MKNKLNLTTQAFIIISIVLLVANFSMGILMITQSGNGMKTLIQQRMRDIANTAAANIDGDVLESLTAEDKDTEGYQAIMDELTIYQDNIELEYIYCIAQAEDGSFVFSVDPTVDDPGEFGEPIVYTDALAHAFSGETAVDDTPYEDRWGRFYSAYAPVFDSKGEVAGVVAVDFDADWYDIQISNTVSIILLCSLVSLAVGALIVVMFTARIRRRFRLLNVELSGLSSEVDKLTSELTNPSEVDNISSGKSNEKNEDKLPGDNIGHLETQIRETRGELERYLNHLHTQEKSMVTALASEYRSVFYVNLDTDKSICYRAPANNKDNLSEGDTFVFSEFFGGYAEKYVLDEYREEFLRHISADYIRSSLEKETTITYRYLSTRSDQEAFEMLHIAGVRRPEDGDDKMIHAVSLGFTDGDKETREALKRNRALSEALAEAEASNKAKTAFLSNMSHEIRTPMNAIIGLDNIVLNDPEISESTRTNLEKIAISANHLLNIINDILDMSRIESGHMALKKEEFSLSGVLEQVNAIISEQCENKGLAYRCHMVKEADRYYIGDDGKIRQILINILGNSVKFTPEGGEVSLTVERVARYEGNTTLRFLMTDTGIGMDKDFIPHIFDAFSQEDSSATNRHGSTGLGMAITKRFVEMMNGNIEVESEKGKGTSFVVTLTLSDADTSMMDIDSGEMNHQDLRVLVAETDKTDCESARMVLEDIGIISDTANSAKRALRLVQLRNARRDPYNLILIDHKLVDEDVQKSLEELREAVGDDVVGLILIGDDREELLKEAEENNAEGVLTRPLSSSDFLDEIKRILDLR